MHGGGRRVSSDPAVSSGPAFRRRAAYAKTPDCSGAVVGDTGIEPVTSSVSGKRAPAAPIAHARWVRDSNPCTRLCRPLPRLSANPPCEPKQLSILRADDGTRTRDPHLGKVMLYQLSHIRASARLPPERRSLTIDRSQRRCPTFTMRSTPRWSFLHRTALSG